MEQLITCHGLPLLLCCREGRDEVKSCHLSGRIVGFKQCLKICEEELAEVLLSALLFLSQVNDILNEQIQIAVIIFLGLDHRKNSVQISDVGQ